MIVLKLMALLRRKQPVETPVKISARSNDRSKIYGPFEPILKFDEPDILITE